MNTRARIFATVLAVAPAIASAVMVYTPEDFKPATGRVVVVIHGCLQSAEAMALGSGWNFVADDNNLAIIYPQVPKGSNGLDCWNWFLPDNQKRETGQLKIVMDQIRAAKSALGLKSTSMFVTGISAGGATAAGLMACFPGEFKGGAVHSSPSYATAQSLLESNIVLRDGPSNVISSAPCRPADSKSSVLVIHGSADMTVNPRNATRVISDFMGHSLSGVKKDLKAGDGTAYSVTDYNSTGQNKGRLVLIEGYGHAWAGFTVTLRNGGLVGPSSKIPTQVPFFSEKGPSSTLLTWEFFKEIDGAPPR